MNTKTVDLKVTFTKIFEHFKAKGDRPTTFATQVGFTTTTQLQNVLTGKSQLSDKAIIGLIENLNVNPMYLFFEEGSMFLSEEDELMKLQKENKDLQEKLEDCEKKFAVTKQQLAKEMKKNDQLQEVNATVIEFYKLKLGMDGNPTDDLSIPPDEDM